MPDQSEHEKLENLVDQPGQAEKSARSLQEAVDSHHSLKGFEAMNNDHFPSKPEGSVEVEDKPSQEADNVA